MYRNKIIIYTAILLSSLKVNGQQYAKLILSTDGVDVHVIAKDETKINQGGITFDEVYFDEFNEAENVEFNFSILNTIDIDDDYTVVLHDPIGDEIYGYQVVDGTIRILYDIESLLLSSSSNPVSLDIVRCDTNIFYVVENKVILCRSIDIGSQLNGIVHVYESSGSEIEIAMGTPTDCEFICEEIKEQFIVLEDFIKWREHVLIDTVIKFKYVEKYSIAEGNNDLILCELLDNHNNILVTEYLSNNYGINLHNWAISDLLEVGERYVVRISGMNKGKVYNIRLRYDGN